MEIEYLAENINNLNYCIYGHRCKTTNKWYIGETSSVDDVSKRFGNSGYMYLKKNTAGTGYKHPKFANAILKYGWNNFEHFILGYYPDDKIDEAECYWIKKKNSIENGYNSTNGGMHSHKLTEENKSKISNRVDQYSLDGVYIKTFKSAKEAAESLNKRNPAIIECCKGLRKTAFGFKWKYSNNRSFRVSNKIQKPKVAVKGFHMATKVNQYDLNMNLIRSFNSVREAAKELSLSETCISRCCRHERKTYKDFIWEYDFKNTPIESYVAKRVVEIKDNIVVNEYRSAAEVGRQINETRREVSKLCTKFIPYNGRYFIYNDTLNIGDSVSAETISKFRR